MHISISGVQWLRKYRPLGGEFVSAHRSGQLGFSSALMRRIGFDPTEPAHFRAGRDDDGNLIVKFVPGAENNEGNGSTWIMRNSLSSFNIKTLMGWEGGKRYRYEVDDEQKALVIYAGTGYNFQPRR